MCNTLEALQKLIDEALVLDGSTGLTITGWSDEDTYDRAGYINRITTPYGVARGGIAINVGGGNHSYSFGFPREQEKPEPVTLDRLRGVLVTALATSQTPESKIMAAAFASLVEKLAANCFHPLSYDLAFEAAEDPTLTINMTNGMNTIRMETKAIEVMAQSVKLDLDVPYVLGQGFVSVLAGGNDRGYGTTGIATLVDGKWVRHTGITSYDAEEKEKINTDALDIEEVMALISEERRELSTKIVIAVIKQLNLLGGSTNIAKVSVAHNEYRGSKPVLMVRLTNAELRKHYNLEFLA